jgi:hypothetical protein
MMGELFGFDGVFVLFTLASLAIPIWAIVDAIARPSAALARPTRPRVSGWRSLP